MSSHPPRVPLIVAVYLQLDARTLIVWHPLDQDWRMPARHLRPGEAPQEAAAEIVFDTTELTFTPHYLLALDYTPQALHLVFDGGHWEGEDSKKLTDTVATRIDLDWVSPTHGDQDVLPGEFARIHAAHHAIQAGREIGTLDQGIPPYPL